MAYKAEQARGVVGGVVNTEHKNVISRAIENVEGVAFGKPVVQGTLDQQARITKAGDTKFVGITLRDRATMGGRFNQFEQARILEEGVVWVEVAEAVSAGNPVVVTVADGGFVKTAAGATAVVMANAFYDSSATVGGLAQVRIK